MVQFSKFSLFLSIFLLSIITQTLSQCPANTQLSNLLQSTSHNNTVTKTLEIDSTVNTPNLSYTQSYSAASFSSTPKVVISIAGYNCLGFTEINYQLSAAVNNTNININFNAFSMNWTSINIILWLNSRQDMIVGTLFAGNFELNKENLKSDSSNQIIQNISNPIIFLSQKNTIYFTFINSLWATSPTNTYIINCLISNKTQNNFTLKISVSNLTLLKKIKINYIIYNNNTALFSTGGGQFSSILQSFSPIYIKIHSKFAPIVYYMLGFEMISLQNSSTFTLNMDIDTDYILGISSLTKIDQIRVSYLSVGQIMTDVCQQCNNTYVYGKSCELQCPLNTYAYTKYAEGGKSCLTCSAKVHQIININGSGCDCMLGYIYNQNAQCQDTIGLQIGQPTFISNGPSFPNITSNIITSNFTTSDQLFLRSLYSSVDTLPSIDVISNATPEIPSSQLNCSVNQIYNQITNACECDNFSIQQNNNSCFRCLNGTFKSSNNCVSCPNSCIVCISITSCNQCIPGTEWNQSTNQCIPAGSTSTNATSANNLQQVPTSNSPIITSPDTSQVCPPNMILINDSCQCDNQSILMADSTCFKCIPGSFKQDNYCSSCSNNCLNCTTSTNCFQCIPGYIFNDSFHACIYQPPIIIPITTTNTTNPPIINQTNISCMNNQIFVNGQCQCNNNSIQFNNQCVSCNSSTYKDPTLQVCQLCTNYHPFCSTCNSILCLSCSNNMQVNSQGKCQCLQPYYLIGTECGQCSSNLIYDPTTLACINSTIDVNENNNNISNSSISNNTSIIIQEINNTNINNQSVNNNTNINNTNINNNNTETNSSELSNTTVPQTTNLNQTTQTNQSMNSTILTNTCRQNEILQNGLCICDNNSVSIFGVCQHCDQGQFKLFDQCYACPDNCLQCISLISCIQCKDKYTFNALQNMCMQSCTDNQVLINGLCQCDQMSISDSQGNCQKCANNTVKVDNSCLNCSQNCLLCTTPSICLQCASGLQLNLANSDCCHSNQLYNSSTQKCQCQLGFMNISGSCGVCATGFIYVDTLQSCVSVTNSTINNGNAGNLIANTSQFCPSGQYLNQSQCQPCLTHCVNCSNQSICNICQSNYTGSQCQSCASGYYQLANATSLQCNSLCGNGIVQGDEQCDDGNEVSGDGCSSACQVENGYACKTTGACTQLLVKASETINSVGVNINFRYTYPLIANSGNLLSINVTNGTIPSNIRVIRPQNDSSIIRILLDYCGLLPPGNILVQLNSSSQLGNIKYITAYDLAHKNSIPITNFTAALKQPDQYLK